MTGGEKYGKIDPCTTVLSADPHKKGDNNVDQLGNQLVSIALVHTAAVQDRDHKAHFLPEQLHQALFDDLMFLLSILYRGRLSIDTNCPSLVRRHAVAVRMQPR